MARRAGDCGLVVAPPPPPGYWGCSAALVKACAGLGRIVALPLIRFILDSLTYSVPLFLNRQCDRTLGGGPGDAVLGEAVVSEMWGALACPARTRAGSERTGSTRGYGFAAHRARGSSPRVARSPQEAARRGWGGWDAAVRRANRAAGADGGAEVLQPWATKRPCYAPSVCSTRRIPNGIYKA